MNRKKLITVIAAGIAALILISILIVGLTDDIWPWDGITAYGRLLSETFQSKGRPTAPVEEDPTEETETVGEEQEVTIPALPSLPSDGDNQVGIEVDIPTTPTGGSEGTTDSSSEPTNGNQGSDNDYDVGFNASDIPGFLS